MAKGHPAGKVPVLRNAMVGNPRIDMICYDSDLFSRSCLQRAARSNIKKKTCELTQLIPPTHLCSTKAIGQSTLSDSDWSPLHDLRVLFGSSSGLYYLLSGLV